MRFRFRKGMRAVILVLALKNSLLEGNPCSGPFWKDEAGVTAIEYGLIAGLIAVVIIGAVTAVGTSVSNKFNAVSNNLSSVLYAQHALASQKCGARRRCPLSGQRQNAPATRRYPRFPGPNLNLFTPPALAFRAKTQAFVHLLLFICCGKRSLTFMAPLFFAPFLCSAFLRWPFRFMPFGTIEANPNKSRVSQ